MFKAGSIRKIEVKNFVTYSYVELCAGPNLNMVIGPNGTGKSTIVAAIILGLGGNPKVVGRGHKVSEYVKHDCTEATINIYLQGPHENDLIKITRIFTKQDKSGWSLNNRKVNVKEIQDCIKEYNIQVDNLCQFLPQDRVQDFAKLNQKELLRATQVALCRDDLIEHHKTLIEARVNYKRLLSVVEKNDEKLQETREANIRLEGKVANFNKKRKFMAKIQDINRKVAWVQFDALHEKMGEVKNDLGLAQQVNDRYKNAARPVEKEITDSKKLVTDLQQRNLNVTRSMRESEVAIRNNLEKVENAKRSINRVRSDMQIKIDEIEQSEKEIETTSSKIDEMKVAQRQLVHQAGNDEEVQQKMKLIANEMQKFKRHCSALEDKREEIIQLKQNKSDQLRAFENENSRLDLENVKHKRLQLLRSVNQDAYEGVVWLRANKHLFKGDVFEPIMMELNVLDQKNAVYVENVIPFRDKIAFGCVLKEDMNNLIRYLRNDKRLTVNLFHCGDTGSYSRYQPTVPIEQLRKYGLYTYLHSLFTAPDPLMNYLCKTYRIHEIPVGMAETSRYYQQLPNHIRLFFSDTQRYSVSISTYTGEKSTRQNEIRSDGSLSIAVDILRLENLKGQMDNLKTHVLTCDTQLREFDTQIQLINEKIAKLADEIRYVNSAKQQAKNLESRIIAMQRKVQEMRQNSTSPETIKNQATRKIQKIIREMKSFQEELKAHYKSFSTLNTKSSLNLVKIENARMQIVYLENKSEEARRLMHESETELNKVRAAYTNIKSQAKAALQKAKSISKNCNPEQEEFDEFREAFDKLSNDIEVLQGEKDRLNGQIDCLNTADDVEMREYEERAQLIGELERDIEKAHVELGKITSQMDNLQEQWLVPLNQLIMEINLKFASAFERMGCAGEVSLNPGDDEKEFADYGLRIKVTYRNGEPLQELNNVVQSGGERAVATAAFMLALQELTPVPFRCVDEINQGMDSNNEKRIMDLLIESTNVADTPQYFLITPKLIPNLSFSRSMMVHIVHNGPFVEPDRKWSSSKLCNPQAVQIH